MTTVKPMNQTEFSKAIDALGLTQVSAARFLGVDPRTCRRYVAGELPLPPAAAMLFRVMARARPRAGRRRQARWATKPQPGLACGTSTDRVMAGRCRGQIVGW